MFPGLQWIGASRMPVPMWKWFANICYKMLRLPTDSGKSTQEGCIWSGKFGPILPIEQQFLKFIFWNKRLANINER